MGTLFTISLYASDQRAAERAVRAAFAQIEELNGVFSDYHEYSQVRWLVRQPAGADIWVGPELFELLGKSQALAEETDGAFDVTLGPLIRHWRRARRQKELPSVEELASVRASVGSQLLHLGDDGRTVILGADGMFVDFGGIAKGYAADAALAVLKDKGFTQVLVAASGDLRAGDPPPGKAGWPVDVASIDAEGGEVTEEILLVNGAVSTSGDTEQFVEIDGVRYSHIVSPVTGIGLTERIGVTVIAPDATTSDSYATAVSVLGAEKGMEFIERHEGVECLIIRLDGDRKLRSQSSGFAKFVMWE